LYRPPPRDSFRRNGEKDEPGCGIEPQTFTLSGRLLYQLSYPRLFLLRLTGFTYYTVTAADKNPKKNEIKKESVTCIGVFFCFLGALALSITAVLIFQGCILANTRVLPNDNCPSYPMDCFVLNQTSYLPISQNASFQCDPTNKTQFPSNIPDASALCFGWVIRQQTTKNILNRLGVCTGLIGLFTTMLAIVVYLGKSIKTLVLCTILILCCGVTCILLLFFK
jgi:hypothetical protein